VTASWKPGDVAEDLDENLNLILINAYGINQHHDAIKTIKHSNKEFIQVELFLKHM
jgi:hypothetical protein